MKEKVWVINLAILLFVFFSCPCLAEEQKAAQQQPIPKKARQVKPVPKKAPQAKAVPKKAPQAKAVPKKAPEAKAVPKKAPEAKAVPKKAPLKPGVAKPGQTHQVERAELDRKMKAPVTRAEQERAANHYREERTRFVRQAPPMRFMPEHRVVLTRMRIVPGTYYYRRNVFYETYGYVPYPYVYTMYPRYGLWDAVFLGFMIERAQERQYALMYYHHRDEEDMRQWRQEMDRMAMDNAELRAKLAAMDQQVAMLQGTPTNSSYIPAGAQDIALSPDVVEQLATGGKR